MPTKPYPDENVHTDKHPHRYAAGYNDDFISCLDSETFRLQ